MGFTIFGFWVVENVLGCRVGLFVVGLAVVVEVGLVVVVVEVKTVGRGVVVVMVSESVTIVGGCVVGTVTKMVGAGVEEKVGTGVEVEAGDGGKVGAGLDGGEGAGVVVVVVVGGRVVGLIVGVAGFQKFFIF